MLNIQVCYQGVSSPIVLSISFEAVVYEYPVTHGIRGVQAVR
jgi:hypothetical protein